MSTTEPKPKKFTICRATIKDALQVGDLSARSFDNDTNSQVKIMAQKPGSFRQGMIDAARHSLENAPEKCAALKAVDDEGKVIGWVCFGFRNVVLDPAPEGKDEGGEGDADDGVDLDERLGASRLSKSHTGPIETGEVESSIPGSERIAKLEKTTSDHLDAFMKKTMPEGTRCMFLGGITIDPSFQGQGVGSELLRWGTQQADRLGVFCWVHSSQAGSSIFEKHGFETVDTLTLDLDEYAIGPPPKGGVFGEMEKWGEYTFRYMVRQPVSI
jgi:GNAT superfamily N-acetyltransferase